MMNSRPDPATKTYRDLYVGNMPGGMLDQQLKELCEKAMEAAGFADGPGSVVQARCTMKFAFVEFRTVEQAANALNLNGIFFMGQFLKIGRPRAYLGPPTPATTWPLFVAAKIQENPSLKDTFPGLAPNGFVGNAAVTSAGGVSNRGDPTTKKYRELYIGNMPDGITSEQLQQFLGQAMSHTGLVPTPDVLHQTRVNGRFAFAEFKTVEATNLALNLNGIPLLNSQLNIGRPRSFDGNPTPHGNWNETCALGLDGLKAKYPGMNPPLQQIMPGSVIAASALTGGVALPVPMPSRPPSRIVQLSNMVTLEDLRDPQECDDIEEDVREEMMKSGKVLSVIIPRPKTEAGSPVDESVGMIYVEFESVQGTLNARKAVEGRTFNGNSVGADFYPEDLFKERKFVDVRKIKMAPAPSVAAPIPPPMPPRPAFGGHAAPPPPRYPPMGGFPPRGPTPAASHGAGRGRNATLPAWMTKS